jgi:hypothetical protein
VRVERVARIVVIAASAWFVFTGVWGMFGVPGGGHLGAGSTATAMATEQMLRWKIIYPSWDWFGAMPPAKTTYACHHPFGCFYLPLPIVALFGHRHFVLHLVPALFNGAVPPLLYGIAKERWGAACGAVAAAAYVVVPIAVGFSGYWNLEMVSISGALLFFWGHSRHMTTRKRRHLVASLAGCAVACSGDWAGYLLVAPLLGWAFLRAFVLPSRLVPRFRLEPYARWWAWSVAVVAGTLVLWFGLYYAADHLADWVTSGAQRSSGGQVKLKDVLTARKDWIDFSFTPLAILLGKIAAPVGVLRAVVLRRDEELYAPALLFGSALQYVAFKQGADVHIFWPMYFAPYYALGLAQLARTLASAVGWVLRRFARERSWQTATAWAALAIGLLPTAAMLHDGVLSLWVWRRTGGRYDDHGTRIRSQVDLNTVIDQVIVPRVAPMTRIDVHPTTNWYWDSTWTYRGQPEVVATPAAGNAAYASHPFWIARGSELSSEEQKKIARGTHVRVYGDIWVVDQREPAAPLDAYSMNEREPNPLEWLVFGGTERMRKAGAAPDPWLTWEWRVHLGQDAPAPDGEPRSLDEMRIAHNVAAWRGDDAGAERWLEKVEAQLDRTVQTRFEPGLRFAGVRVVGGVEPRVESWFEVTAQPAGDAVLRVRSTMEARSPLSLIPPDATDRDMTTFPLVATKLWRPRFLYCIETILNHRIGRERYLASWAPRDGAWSPRRADGQAETSLAVVR